MRRANDQTRTTASAPTGRHGISETCAVLGSVYAAHGAALRRGRRQSRSTGDPPRRRKRGGFPGASKIVGRIIRMPERADASRCRHSEPRLCFTCGHRKSPAHLSRPMVGGSMTVSRPPRADCLDVRFEARALRARRGGRERPQHEVDEAGGRALGRLAISVQLKGALQRRLVGCVHTGEALQVAGAGAAVE